MSSVHRGSIALASFTRAHRMFHTTLFTRQTCRASVDPQASAEAPSVLSSGQKRRKTRQKITKSLSDLPTTYINPDGKPAIPLKDYIPGEYIPRHVELSESQIRHEPHEEKHQNNSQKDPAESIAETSKSHVKKLETRLSHQILGNLERLPHCLLLTRVGQFYESYFEQAAEISRLLNIKLASRKMNGSRIPMCGFPLTHLDKHLKILVQQEKRFVAMCEEFPSSTATNGKEFNRRISRIITPGTLIDESFLDPLDNNYILAVASPDNSDCGDVFNPIGLAWMDVSTGQFFYKACDAANFQDELARIDPREVILRPSNNCAPNHPILSVLKETGCTVSYLTQEMSASNSTSTSNLSTRTSWSPSTQGQRRTDDLIAPKGQCTSQSSPDDPAPSSREALAVNLLIDFLQVNLLEHMPVLESPIHESMQQLMQIDSHTISALELRENNARGNGITGSLFGVIKRTVTSGGTRLLARRVCSPSTSLTEINTRLSLVSMFKQRTHFHADICELLKEVDDIERLCQKLSLGRADLQDLISIQSTIQIWNAIWERVQQEKKMESIENADRFNSEDWTALDALFERTSNLDNLAQEIQKAIINPADSASDNVDIDDDVPSPEDNATDPVSALSARNDTNTWSINPEYSEESIRLHNTLKGLLSVKDEMQNELSSKYLAPSLTLRSSSANGFFVHLARAKRQKYLLDNDPHFHSIGESMSTKSYFHKPWSELGNRIIETSSTLVALEKRIFDDLRVKAIDNSRILRQNSQVIDELDVAASLSLLAREMHFVRPEITEDATYNVKNGRHPTVEMGLLSSGRQFVSNSVQMHEDANLHIITGPNMAGKSTLLRQTALITILAQIGSFVPADYARIGIVDKLFARIGARDDLFRDRSTFMVEMLETADILRRATGKSLVIMDEVGRGTTVTDGLAIAFGALHHLVNVNRSRCLFATHFHELAEMVGNIDDIKGSGVFDNVRFFCTDVDDAGDGHFSYAYRLSPGINRDSHGLKVAGLAGMPPAALAIASDTLDRLKGGGSII